MAEASRNVLNVDNAFLVQICLNSETEFNFEFCSIRLWKWGISNRGTRIEITMRVSIIAIWDVDHRSTEKTRGKVKGQK